MCVYVYIYIYVYAALYAKKGNVIHSCLYKLPTVKRRTSVLEQQLTLQLQTLAPQLLLTRRLSWRPTWYTIPQCSGLRMLRHGFADGLVLPRFVLSFFRYINPC